MGSEDSILVSERVKAAGGEGMAADTVVRDRFPAEPNASGRTVELKARAA